jgi:UDP:flavonoid glycosyltransferase YjiC (YdhE family)
MAAGVPIVGIPTLIDQDSNMARVVDLGLGVVVPERRFRTETLGAAIDEVLREERYRARARDASAAVAEFDAPRTAARLIADLAEAPGAAAARPDGTGDRRAHRESD